MNLFKTFQLKYEYIDKMEQKEIKDRCLLVVDEKKLKNTYVIFVITHDDEYVFITG